MKKDKRQKGKDKSLGEEDKREKTKVKKKEKVKSFNTGLVSCLGNIFFI